MLFVINGIRWEVLFCRPNSDNLRRSDGSMTVGVTDFNTRCVYLSELLRGPFLRKVFIHEVCHAAVFSYGIHIGIEEEEFLCDFVSTYGDEIFHVVDEAFSILKRRVS